MTEQPNTNKPDNLVDKIFGNNKGVLFWLALFAITGIILYGLYIMLKNGIDTLLRPEVLITILLIGLGLLIYKNFSIRKARSVDAFKLIERAREKIVQEWGILEVPPSDASISVEPTSNGALIFFATKGIQIRYNSLFDTFEGIKFVKWRKHAEDVRNEALPDALREGIAQESLKQQARDLQK